MKRHAFNILTVLFFLLNFESNGYAAHDIIFCGERIPVTTNFVAEKLMNVIRRQIPGVNLPQLRKRVEENFPIVEYYLRETGLPEDFKYLAIVESGFQNLTSRAGARGFWQLMPLTARALGLVVSETVDERDDIYKSTYAACKELASSYRSLKKKFGVKSWVLTAATYNHGINNMSNAIVSQGSDYFSMKLNEETAQYVYKIIAVKELFEYPELYIKDFGYNVFSNLAAPVINPKAADEDTKAFNSLEVKVSEKDVKHPEDITVKESIKPYQKNKEIKAVVNGSKFQYIGGKIKGRYSDYEDGNFVVIELLENLEVKGSFNRKGNRLKAKGWIIGDRIYVDLGYDSHDVTLIDVNGDKGIPLQSLKNNETVFLKLANESDKN